MKVMTSAGNLLAWGNHIRETLESVDQAAALHLEEAFSDPPDLSWVYGLRSFERLLHRAKADVQRSSVRQQRYLAMLKDELGLLIQPAKYNGSSVKLAAQALGPHTVERLETLDDALRLEGLCTKPDDARTGAVVDEINDLLLGLDGAEIGSVEAFVYQKLSELKAVLEAYEYYGSEGVEHAIQDLLGQVLINGLVNSNLPESVKRLGGRLIGLSKAALDLVVYSKDVNDGIGWAGTQLAGLFGPPGG
jgi:hypothetical protein